MIFLFKNNTIFTEFKIPLWNSVDIAMFLASQAKFAQDKLRGIELIVDLAEYYKVTIESEVRSTTCLPPQFHRNGIFFNFNIYF